MLQLPIWNDRKLKFNCLLTELGKASGSQTGPNIGLTWLELFKMTNVWASSPETLTGIFSKASPWDSMV